MIKQVMTIALSVLASHAAFAATNCTAGDICINNQTATATPLTTVNNIVVSFKGHDSASESCDYEITSSNSNQTSWVISGNHNLLSFPAYLPCAEPPAVANLLSFQRTCRVPSRQLLLTCCREHTARPQKARRSHTSVEMATGSTPE